MRYSKGVATELSKNFESTEFDCHGKGCCNQTEIYPSLIDYLQKIRDHFKKPVIISSAYRCTIHNKNVNGATGSRHTKGQAADIYITGVAPIEIARYAEKIGIKGIGLYETKKDGYFVHIDTRTSKSFWYGQAQAYRSTFQPKNSGVETTKPIQTDKENVIFRNGSKGEDVKTIQSKLANLGYDVGYIDGFFGKKTEEAVRAFQKDNNLDRDGICGPKTLTMLNAAKYSKGEVIANLLNVRSGAGLNYNVRTTIKRGTKIIIVSEKNGWARLINDAGYVSLDYIKKF